MTALLEMDAISYTYRSKVEIVSALSEFSLQLSSGESVALMGPSGSGKTTALLIAGLMRLPQSGALRIEGSPAPTSEKERARLRNGFFGSIFQEYALIEELRAWENVAIPLEYAPARIPRRRRRQLAIAELERYGISDVALRRVRHLSGGQRQRVAIARATICRPAVVLADEPTAALDSAARDGILDVFDGLRRADCGILIATHDPAVAQRCDRVVSLPPRKPPPNDAGAAGGVGVD